MMYFSIEMHDDHDDEHDFENVYKKKVVDDIPETNYSFVRKLMFIITIMLF